jgi:hypothetical protein
MSAHPPILAFPVSLLSLSVRAERTPASHPSRSRAISPRGRQTPCSHNLPLCRRLTRKAGSARSAILDFELSPHSSYEHPTSQRLTPSHRSRVTLCLSPYRRSHRPHGSRKSLPANTYGLLRNSLNPRDFKSFIYRSYGRFFRKSFRIRSYVIKGGWHPPPLSSQTAHFPALILGEFTIRGASHVTAHSRGLNARP